ncbi:MAG: hypothetical protein KAU26_11565 [Methylococcales bacterium]|nr:hypothetical protein [Methylococcales bacterium]
MIYRFKGIFSFFKKLSVIKWYQKNNLIEIKNRGLISVVVDLAVLAYDLIKENILYGAAENYNATLFYIEGKGVVTKIILNHK